MAVYLDSSAFVKLVVAEAESTALRSELAKHPTRASSQLLRTEVVRALRRAQHHVEVGRARRAFRTLHLIELVPTLLDRAAELDPDGLSSLDAIHVASALFLGDGLECAITYDARQRQAFELAGIEVRAPS